MVAVTTRTIKKVLLFEPDCDHYQMPIRCAGNETLVDEVNTFINQQTAPLKTAFYAGLAVTALPLVILAGWRDISFLNLAACLAPRINKKSFWMNR